MYHTKGDKPDWSRPINAWAAEAANFKYGVGSVNGKMVGHWTQVMPRTKMQIYSNTVAQTYLKPDI